MSFFKPMTGLKFFVNTTKPMPKFRPYIYDKILKFKTKPMLRPFMNTSPDDFCCGGPVLLGPVPSYT